MNQPFVSDSPEPSSPAPAIPFRLIPRLGAAGWTLIAILLACKLAAVLALVKEPYSDETVYLGIAGNLESGAGYISMHGNPTASVLPGFPFLLAAILKLSGGMLFPAYILQVILSGIIAAAYGRLVWLWTGRADLARLAALLIWVWPPYIQYASLLMTEIPYSAFLALALLSWEETRRSPTRLASWAPLGAFHAAAFMTRPVTFPLLPLILLWPLAESRFHRRAWLGAGLAFAISLAAWLPWVARNHQVFGRFVPLSTLSGYIRMGGAIDDMSRFNEVSETAMRNAGIMRFEDDEPGANEAISLAAGARVRAAPLHHLLRSAGRSWRFWLAEYPAYFGLRGRIRDLFNHGRWAELAAKLSLLAMNLLLVFGAAMACAAHAVRRRHGPFLLLLVYFTITHALLMPIARYSVPLHGLVIALVLSLWPSELAHSQDNAGKRDRNQARMEKEQTSAG